MIIICVSFKFDFFRLSNEILQCIRAPRLHIYTYKPAISVLVRGFNKLIFLIIGFFSDTIPNRINFVTNCRTYHSDFESPFLIF
ncbi:hypothetical protein LF63_0106735 [Oleiagrimonas soli]|uniref:Uncharacterized protein n=1 Tax=Oleiagrimonas soli TaxID=1543381 RepID=A0A099CYH6_9GAMM|nr:hypothetical protein LF63_0106735 [Oleiagrimonas soli]